MNASEVSLALVATAAVAIGGCGGNDLRGSIGEVLSLAYDTVALVKHGDELGVEYQAQRDDGGVDKVCIIVLDASGMLLTDNTAITGEIFADRVTLRRSVRAEDHFPEVGHGRLDLAEISFRDGGDVTGELTAVFVNRRTLESEFSGTIVERQ
jgi:hypothetical protein